MVFFYCETKTSGIPPGLLRGFVFPGKRKRSWSSGWSSTLPWGTTRPSSETETPVRPKEQGWPGTRYDGEPGSREGRDFKIQPTQVLSCFTTPLCVTTRPSAVCSKVLSRPRVPLLRILGVSGGGPTVLGSDVSPWDGPSCWVPTTSSCPGPRRPVLLGDHSVTWVVTSTGVSVQAVVTSRLVFRPVSPLTVRGLFRRDSGSLGPLCSTKGTPLWPDHALPLPVFRPPF